MNRKKCSDKSGFTLAELLIVVAIIAVLVAVSIPIFASRIAKAKETVCKNERATMKHACVIEAMSNEIDWNDYIEEEGAVNNPGDVAQTIMRYLEIHNSIDVFECQSGGIITAVVNAEGNSVTFLCSVHDKLNDGDSGGGSIGSATSEAQDKLKKDLEEYLKEYDKSFPGKQKDNNTFLKEFFKKYPKYNFDEAKPSEVLNQSQIEQWLNNIEATNKDNAKATVEKYLNSSYSVVPYWYNKGEVITYYTSTSNISKFNGENGPNHASTNMFCYNGDWYVSTNLSKNDTEFNGSNNIAWLHNLSPDKLKETAKEKGWIKL